MLELIENEKALSLVSRYFTLLGKTGYVRKRTVSRYLMYLFLVDFVDTIYPFITDEDYNKVSSLLVALFSGAGCLLPYQTNCVHNTVIGLPSYMGDYVKRITEDAEDRFSEQDEPRAF